MVDTNKIGKQLIDSSEELLKDGAITFDECRQTIQQELEKQGLSPEDIDNFLQNSKFSEDFFRYSYNCGYNNDEIETFATWEAYIHDALLPEMQYQLKDVKPKKSDPLFDKFMSFFDPQGGVHKETVHSILIEILTCAGVSNEQALIFSDKIRDSDILSQLGYETGYDNNTIEALETWRKLYYAIDDEMKSIINDKSKKNSDTELDRQGKSLFYDNNGNFVPMDYNTYKEKMTDLLNDMGVSYYARKNIFDNPDFYAQFSEHAFLCGYNNDEIESEITAERFWYAVDDIVKTAIANDPGEPSSPSGPTPSPSGPTPSPSGPTPSPSGPTPSPSGPTPSPSGPPPPPSGPPPPPEPEKETKPKPPPLVLTPSPSELPPPSGSWTPIPRGSGTEAGSTRKMIARGAAGTGTEPTPSGSWTPIARGAKPASSE